MKKFKLPKEFREEWIKALRSGEYNQADGQLFVPENEEIAGGYCCLGVACSMQGIEDKYLTAEIIENTLYAGRHENDTVAPLKKGVPEMLIGDNKKFHIYLLTSLNDGISQDHFFFKDRIHKLFTFTEKEYLKFVEFLTERSTEKDNKRYKLDFNGIADLLENYSEDE